MSHEADTVETLRLVEALLAGATTDGERAAAASARERMLAKLRRIREKDPQVEFQFSMPDPWCRRLLVAVLRKYELRPYRYRRQRRSTVMTRSPRRVMDDIVLPEFEKIRLTLEMHLMEVANRIVQQALQSDGSEAEVIQGELPLP